MSTSTTTRFFLDTNIAVYCFDSSEPRKQNCAKDLVAHAASSGLGVVSYQVLQEFCNVAVNAKRLSLNMEQIMAYTTQLLQPMNKVGPSTDLLAQALHIRVETSYAFYDSLIIAAAQLAGCSTLYSEDMQHEQLVGGVRIVNPFVDAAHESISAIKVASPSAPKIRR
jgi:predicted nucleic acid-binding protein